MFWIGLGLLVTVVGFIVMFASDGPLMRVGIGLAVGPITLLVVLVALALMFGNISLSPEYVENACYRAVRTTTTTLIPAGKVLIPTTTSGISLQEIRCP